MKAFHLSIFDILGRGNTTKAVGINKGLKVNIIIHTYLTVNQ